MVPLIGSRHLIGPNYSEYFEAELSEPTVTWHHQPRIEFKSILYLNCNLYISFLFGLSIMNKVPWKHKWHIMIGLQCKSSYQFYTDVCWASDIIMIADWSITGSNTQTFEIHYLLDCQIKLQWYSAFFWLARHSNYCRDSVNCYLLLFKKF